jgi:antitoxin VapB
VTQTAKLFMNGCSQAVRLPAAFRFDATEVFIRRDPVSGDVILSRQPPDWDGFFAALVGAETPDDFHPNEERNQGVADRDPFAGWRECSAVGTCSTSTPSATFGSLDLLIAAHALAAGAVLATNDRAFTQIPQLQIEDWTVDQP